MSAAPFSLTHGVEQRAAHGVRSEGASRLCRVRMDTSAERKKGERETRLKELER